VSSVGGPDHLPIEVLTELARSASEDPLPRVFEVVADTLRTTAGYQTMTLNIYRPAWDGFETVFVRGRDGIDALLGDICSRDALLTILDHATISLNAIYFFTDATEILEDQDEVVASFVPDLPDPDSDDGWHAQDGLVAMLRDASGEPLGFVSVDEPVSGMRPTADDLNLMQLICAFAEQALRSARRAETAEADVRLRTHLTTLSPAISACVTHEALDRTMLDAILEHFGFMRACIYSVIDQHLRLDHAAGWHQQQPPAHLNCWPQLSAVMDARHEPHAVLRPAEELFGPSPVLSASSYNGEGPVAWNDDCLLLPWRDEDSRLTRLVVLQDPTDRLLPSTDRQQVLQLLIDLAASVAGGIEHRSRLDRLASYDALTGIRNRRGLEALIEAQLGVALLTCDLDHFKSINDRYGHARGDMALAEFGALLRESSRTGDIPVRIGGEEFCVVLPGTGGDQAIAFAERLRAQTELRLARVIPGGVTVSIGIAVAGADRPDAEALLRQADEALYRAKQSGRNRVESSAGKLT
jgi:diguanylate cyclase (GGDEF)-like protein